MKLIRNQNGVALITALLMSLVIMVMVTGTLYFINQSTKMSGAGKRYSTAEEAAAGAIDLIKDSINLTIWGGSTSGLITSGCFSSTVLVNGSGPCAVAVELQGVGGNYSAAVVLERLFSRALPGGRLEFSRSAGGAPSTSMFFKISTKVEGPANSTAENSALYRWAG